MNEPIKSPYPREQLPDKKPVTFLMVIDSLAYAISMATALFVVLGTPTLIWVWGYSPTDLAIPVSCIAFLVSGLMFASPLAYKIQAYLAIGCALLIFLLALISIQGTWIEGPAALGITLLAIIPWRAVVFALRRAKSLEQKRAMRALQANQQDKPLP